MPTDDELLDLLARSLEPGDRAPSPDRVAALRAAVAQPADHAPPIPLDFSRRRPRFSALAAAAAAAAVLVAFFVGSSVAERSETTDLAGGTVEFEVALGAPGGDASADVVGIKTGIGRVVRLRSDDLPILPKGEYYEVWFVGPGDSPAQRNRISAGTFHPDDQGRSEVELTAAVDPAKYPGLSVTAEPGDGNPAPNGPEVLRTLIGVRQ